MGRQRRGQSPSPGRRVPFIGTEADAMSRICSIHAADFALSPLGRAFSLSGQGWDCRRAECSFPRSECLLSRAQPRFERVFDRTEGECPFAAEGRQVVVGKPGPILKPLAFHVQACGHRVQRIQIVAPEVAPTVAELFAGSASRLIPATVDAKPVDIDGRIVPVSDRLRGTRRHFGRGAPAHASCSPPLKTCSACNTAAATPGCLAGFHCFISSKSGPKVRYSMLPFS